MPEADRSPSGVRIDWQPAGRRITVRPGTSLLAAARAAGLDLVAICGGAGLCEGCRVRAVAGRLSPVTELERSSLGDEAIRAGWRLACQASVETDTTLDVPPESLTAPQRLQVEGQLSHVPPDPAVRMVDVSVEPPALGNLRSDLSRVTDALATRGVDRATATLPVLADLPARLRRLGWSASVAVRGSDIVAVLARGQRPLGLAVDVGTTKLAAYLVDLTSGETLGAVGRMNPQIALGEDVISRIAYVADDAGRRHELQGAVIGALNGMAAEALRRARSRG